MTHTIKPLDEGDVGGRRVMRPPESLEVIRAIEKQEPTPTPPPTEPSATPEQGRVLRLPGSDGSDWVRIPGTDILIGKHTIHQGRTWEESHEALQAQHLFMPTLPLFMRYLQRVAAFVNGADMTDDFRDGDGNRLIPDQLQSLADYLLGTKLGTRTRDRVSTWVDAKFVQDPNGFNRLGIEIDHEVKTTSSGDVRKTLESRIRARLEPYIIHQGYVSLNPVNQSGLPLTRRRPVDLTYDPGRNMYFSTPHHDRVTMFSIDDVLGAHLDCMVDPLEDKKSGVLPCIRVIEQDDGTKKYSGKRLPH